MLTKNFLKKYKNRNLISIVFDYIPMNKVFKICFTSKILKNIIKEKYNLPFNETLINLNLSECYKLSELFSIYNLNNIKNLSNSELIFFFAKYFKTKTINEKFIFDYNNIDQKFFDKFFRFFLVYDNKKNIEFNLFNNSTELINFNYKEKLNLKDLTIHHTNIEKDFFIFNYIEPLKIEKIVIYKCKINIEKKYFLNYKNLKKLIIYSNEINEEFLNEIISLLTNNDKIEVIKFLNNDLIIEENNIKNIIDKIVQSIKNQKKLKEIYLKFNNNNNLNYENLFQSILNIYENNNILEILNFQINYKNSEFFIPKFINNFQKIKIFPNKKFEFNLNKKIIYSLEENNYSLIVDENNEICSYFFNFNFNKIFYNKLIYYYDNNLLKFSNLTDFFLYILTIFNSINLTEIEIYSMNFEENFLHSDKFKKIEYKNILNLTIQIDIFSCNENCYLINEIIQIFPNIKNITFKNINFNIYIHNLQFIKYLINEKSQNLKKNKLESIKFDNCFIKYCNLSNLISNSEFEKLKLILNKERNNENQIKIIYNY